MYYSAWNHSILTTYTIPIKKNSQRDHDHKMVTQIFMKSVIRTYKSLAIEIMW